MSINKLLLIAATTSILLINNFITCSAAENNTQIGRYLATPNQPLLRQADLLTQTFQIRFPSSVKTISDAANYLLQFSGYSLVTENNLIPEARQLMTLPLPQADRNLGPLSLKDGLLTLVGNPFGLLVDPVHRLISFRLLPDYRPLYQPTIHFIFK